jgi:predicted RNA binding protein YcfA (HicA-like mRNA interferase family)
MSRVPSFTAQKIIKILRKNGFVLDRSSGSHQIWIHKEEKRRVVLPMHKKDLPKGTFFAVLRQAGIDKREI